MHSAHFHTEKRILNLVKMHLGQKEKRRISHHDEISHLHIARAMLPKDSKCTNAPVIAPLIWCIKVELTDTWPFVRVELRRMNVMTLLAKITGLQTQRKYTLKQVMTHPDKKHCNRGSRMANCKMSLDNMAFVRKTFI